MRGDRLEAVHGSIRGQISAAIRMIVQLQRLSDGKRRVTSIAEITGMEGDIVQMQEIYKFVRTSTAEDGSYPIVPSAAVGSGLSNYAITYVPGTLTVLEPAIVVTTSSLTTINEGDASASVEVATFTHANGVEDPSHFSATVDWGIAGHCGLRRNWWWGD